MPSKKKKYNSRFPPARIKKIMQTDDEIGKVAAAVPVLISKCLEMFLTSILTSAGEVTKEKRAKTMSTSHLKECIMNVSMFDFLKDTVSEVPDMQNEEEPGPSGIGLSQEVKKLSKKRSQQSANVQKKRVKLTVREYTEDSETNESIDVLNVDDDENGTTVPSNDLIPPTPKGRLSDARDSFHISLDALMSNNPSSRGSRPVKITGDEAQEMNTNYSGAISEKPDSVNGLSSPQKPMDLTVNSSENRATSKVEHSSKTAFDARKEPVGNLETSTSLENSSQAQLGPVEATQNIPIPLTMSHLFNPKTLPPAPPVATSLSKDLSAKIPKGGMLNFLYSDIQGDPGIPLAPQTKPTGPDPRYPYNPVAEHYKRSMPMPGVPYAPTASASPGVPRMQISQQTDDDDYDN